MRQKGDNRTEEGYRGSKPLIALNSEVVRQRARKLSLAFALCYLFFSGVWFTWLPVLLSRSITDPKELENLESIETILFIGLTSILVYGAVRITTTKLLDIKLRLQRSEEDLLNRLGQAAEWRDDETSDHTLRVGEYCELLAQGLGQDSSECERIRKAGMLHDIGKIGIPDFVMTKSGELNEEERGLMQAHTLMGSDLLADSDVPMIQMAQRVAAAHHERWDGKGYPYGLKGEDIPLEGRIAAVADVFDALTSRRRYKAAWPFEVAVAEIEKSAGTQFDPRIVSVFLEKKEEFKRVHDKYAHAARAININRAA